VTADLVKLFVMSTVQTIEQTMRENSRIALLLDLCYDFQQEGITKLWDSPVRSMNDETRSYTCGVLNK
jgi:hypothetical protein